MPFLHEICDDDKLREEFARKLFAERLGKHLSDTDCIADLWIDHLSTVLIAFGGTCIIPQMHEIYEHADEAVESYYNSLRSLDEILAEHNRKKHRKEKAINDDTSAT